jgi:hypothetical protein
MRDERLVHENMENESRKSLNQAQYLKVTCRGITVPSHVYELAIGSRAREPAPLRRNSSSGANARDTTHRPRMVRREGRDGKSLHHPTAP